MVRVVRGAIFALCISWSASASATPVTGLSHRDRLYDATLADGQIYVVGHPGLILRSTDGGKNFENVQAGQHEEAFFSVAFNRKGQGVIAGRSGVVMVTLDHGKIWKKSVVTLDDEHPRLASVAILGDGAIVAVGEFGKIVRSEDHGQTWSRASFAVELEPSVQKKADACGKQHASSAQVAEPAGMGGDNADMLPEARLTDVVFLDDAHGLVVGEFGLVLRTEDAGRTFKRQASCTDRILYSVASWGSTNALAVGAEGTIIESSDGGITWTPRNSGTPEHLFGVWADANRAVITGAVGTALVRKANEPFERVSTGVYSWLTGSVLDDKGRGVIVGGRGYVRRTDDGGNTQQRVLGE